MGDELKKRVQRAYINLKEETIDKDGIIEGGVKSLTFGCFLDNNCDITKCRSKDFQPEDSFIMKEDNVDATKYPRDCTIIPYSIIPNYTKISKKSKGECCPFYEFKCRFILDAVFREVYGENYKI